jgi:hypothetical protein
MTVMPPDVEDEVRLRRYLLGELPDEDRERLQAAYFADGELFVRLLGVERGPHRRLRAGRADGR